MLLLTEVHTYSDVLSFFFLRFQGPVQDKPRLVSMPPSALLGCDGSSARICLIVFFSMIRLSLRFWGSKAAEVNYHFHYIRQKYFLATGLIPDHHLIAWFLSGVFLHHPFFCAGVFGKPSPRTVPS